MLKHKIYIYVYALYTYISTLSDLLSKQGQFNCPKKDAKRVSKNALMAGHKNARNICVCNRARHVEHVIRRSDITKTEHREFIINLGKPIY